ncbi:hypothetical protein GW17_00043548 [Ensete ventricosum]|nr:hypothetical protein GW17_00043548 [Ensete ventricosum]
MQFRSVPLDTSSTYRFTRLPVRGPPATTKIDRRRSIEGKEERRRGKERRIRGEEERNTSFPCVVLVRDAVAALSSPTRRRAPARGSPARRRGLACWSPAYTSFRTDAPILSSLQNYRICKGKACAEDQSEGTISSFRSIPEEKMRRPLIRPLCINSSDSDCKPLDPESKLSSLVSLPPPPARHTEREKFFKEKSRDGSGIAGHMRGLSLDSRNGSSSRSGSTDCSERDVFGFRDSY